jgi:ABC-type lipopolysaccharide export system ATPase subunit
MEFVKEGKSDYKGCTKVKAEDKVKAVVRNTSFAVDSGEVLGLLGPNGAGKTTTLFFWWRKTEYRVITINLRHKSLENLIT